MRRLARTDDTQTDPARRRATATACVVAAITLTWGYERIRFGARPTIAELHVLGGTSWDALRLGELWRVPAGALLHASWAHVLQDAVAIAVVGFVVERRTSATAVATALSLGCLASSIGALVQLPGGMTVGASGLLFALLGLGATTAGRLRVVMFTLLGAGLAYGAVSLATASPGHTQVTSLGAHVGGAAAGVLAGLAPTGRRVALVAGGALVAVLALGAAPMVASSSPRGWSGDASARTALDPVLVERTLVGFPARSPVNVVDARCRRRAGHRISCRLRERGGQTVRVWFADHATDLALEDVPAP